MGPRNPDNLPLHLAFSILRVRSIGSGRSGWMKAARYVVALLILGLAVLLFPSGPVKIPPRANLPSPQDAGVTAWKKDVPAPPQDAEPETSLVFLLRSQAEAWNRGDIEGLPERGQPPQRLAHRRARHAELLGELFLAKDGPGGELPRDDRL